jgi:hypothetical protein
MAPNSGVKQLLSSWGSLISNANPAGATTVDGKGGYLIPGLIDAHCQVTSCSHLTTLRQYGVTIAVDMGTYPYSAISACKARGVTWFWCSWNGQWGSWVPFRFLYPEPRCWS